MNLKDKTLWQRNAAAIGGMVYLLPESTSLSSPPVCITAVSLVSARSSEPY